MTGTLNFAQAAIGCFGAFVFLASSQGGANATVAFLAGIAASGLVAALLGLVMTRWFMDASLQMRSSVTIAMLIGLLALGFRAFGDTPRAIPDLFGDARWTIAGVGIGATSMAVVGLAIVLAAAVSALLRTTQIGFDVRALAERPAAAELLGVPAKTLTVGIWAVTGAISAAAITLIAPSRSASFLSLSLLAFPALAAALVGAFKSLPLTIAGGAAIGLLEGMASQSDVFALYRGTISFVVVVCVLLWSQRREVWDTSR